MDGNPCAVYEPLQTGNRVRLQRPDNIITVILRKSKREPVDFLQEMAVFVMKNAHGGRRRKFFENLKNRLDSHDKLWYPVVTARLVKPNQSSSDSLQRDACNSL